MRGLRGLWVTAELTVTAGVLVLLFVVHQLWWTDQRAMAGMERQVRALQQQWDEAPARTEEGEGREGAPGAENQEGAGGSRSPASGKGHGEGGGGRGADAPRRDQAYAVIRIPRIGLTAPVAQGISRAGVLNKGYVGHYPGTAQPGEPGNFALAGHRNTHGEPFRYINRLRNGDRIEVETARASFTYVVERTLPQTSPRDTAVIGSVPRSEVRRGYGFGEAGYYITLTTCTPEYTSRYRLVVWGRLRAAEPR
ncbi:class E sortase [Streptomyces sp. GC420]|uniref:class E sortase n=1 Tax=Streptomyces sp. GC420 TaxID=2697568 RepID=UPI0028BE7EA4|nr:class E sortase [Streptomyces sp. GC420]